MEIGKTAPVVRCRRDPSLPGQPPQTDRLCNSNATSVQQSRPRPGTRSLPLKVCCWKGKAKSKMANKRLGQGQGARTPRAVQTQRWLSGSHVIQGQIRDLISASREGYLNFKIFSHRKEDSLCLLCVTHTRGVMSRTRNANSGRLNVPTVGGSQCICFQACGRPEGRVPHA